MSWPVATVGEVCEVVSGATPRTGKPEFWDGNVPWVTPKDLSELGQKHLSDTPRKITKAGLKNCSARMLPAQSVLFSSRAPIGLVAINTIPVCTNQGFKSLVPRFDLVSPDFLFWWLKAQEKHVQSKGRGATFKEVSKKIVEDLQIPLPPLAEQKRIAGILDAADALRAKRREALAELDTLLQATFLDMFGDPVTNPMGWDAPPLADFCKTGTGGTPSRGKMQRYYEGGTIPWVKSGELREEVITSTDEHITETALKETNVKLVPKDALLLALYGATVGRLGILKRFSNRPCTTWGGRGTSARTDAGGPMRAYSMDLRERALLDSDAGMKAAEVAAKYRVSGSWVRLLKQRRRDTGEVAPRVQRHGRRGMLEPHLHTLAALIAAHPDRTLAELKDALATPASVPTVWRAVRALGLTVKKHGPPVRTRSA